jgi:hypothetical protein
MTGAAEAGNGGTARNSPAAASDQMGIDYLSAGHNDNEGGSLTLIYLLEGKR